MKLFDFVWGLGDVRRKCQANVCLDIGFSQIRLEVLASGAPHIKNDDQTGRKTKRLARSVATDIASEFFNTGHVPTLVVVV